MVYTERIWEEYGLDKLQQGLDALFPQYEFSLNELLQLLWQGDFLGCVTGLMQGSVRGILSYTNSVKNVLVWLLILGLASSVISHFVELFDKNQVGDLSFYFIYLLFMTILLKCFGEMVSITRQTMENIVLFMQLMIPTYMLAVGAVHGLSSATVSYQIMLGLVYLVEHFLKEGVIVFVEIYTVFVMMNGVWIEEKLSLMIDLVKKGIEAALKLSLWMVTGISVFQSMLSPILTSVKSTALQKMISSIPGIGDAAEGVLEIVLGAAGVIKNSIGIVCLLILLCLCAGPLFYVFLMAFVMRIAAAMLGIVSDSRLSACADQMGEAGMLLFRTTLAAVALFMISISIVALTTVKGV